jgi:hypothetical protein
MRLGDRRVERGMQGQDVEELQVRLAGFRGTVPDGDFGPGTELQVVCFQRDFMGMATPSGACDGSMLEALDDFARRYPIDFDALQCPCGVCDGFGQGRFRGTYSRPGQRLEAFHLYEYPGIHRMLLWAVRALFFYARDERFVITSGYRCGVRNEQRGRTSTNHHGKAIDVDAVGHPGEDRRDDMERCNRLRGLLVERSNAQVGWAATNRKALEPSDIAPTWVHYDVRCYETRYLEDRFFCRDLEGLNGPAVASLEPVAAPRAV